MKHLDEFIVPLSGNKETLVEHSFVLDKSFFEHFDDQEIGDARLMVLMILKKNVSAFEIHFKLNGELTVACDRCLEAVVQSINYETDLLVKRGERYEEIDDKVLSIPREEERLNIASFLYEYAKLALPIQRMHAEGDCNSEMMAQMEKYQRKSEESRQTDARWGALASLKDALQLENRN